MNTQKITRLEVIDEEGRKYVQWDCSVVVSIQDNGRTMKCFVNKVKPQSLELPLKPSSEAVCQTCWKKNKIQADCPDCNGTGKRL
jgi:RecJ-like exonuclease